jgi:TRAP-type mannitol/chloroaromatic compound transport system permease small subunit
LQELEWHSHTALFALVLGFGYVWNTHVRVDLVRENLNFRKKAWLELIGITIFLVPFTCIIIYFAFMYSYDSWAFNRPEGCAWWQCGEISASLVGLSHRWMIKGVLVIGLVVALLAGIAVWLQVVIALFGPRHWRFDLMTIEWPEDTGAIVEGKERVDLETAEDQLELQARRMRERVEAENQQRE